MPKENIEKAKQSPETTPVMKALKEIGSLQRDMMGEMGKISGRVQKLEQVKVLPKMTTPNAPRIIEDDGLVKSEMMEGSGIKGAPIALKMEPSEPKPYPVPDDYKLAKDQILGEDFGMRMMVEADRPTFTLQILVPDDKSNMTDLQKELSIRKDNAPIDIRTNSFNQGSSASSITGWLMLIRQNLKLDN